MLMAFNGVYLLSRGKADSRVERTLERLKGKEEEEAALRGRGTREDEEEWRLEYLKGLNKGLGSDQVRHSIACWRTS